MLSFIFVNLFSFESLSVVVAISEKILCSQYARASVSFSCCIETNEISFNKKSCCLSILKICWFFAPVHSKTQCDQYHIEFHLNHLIHWKRDSGKTKNGYTILIRIGRGLKPSFFYSTQYLIISY